MLNIKRYINFRVEGIIIIKGGLVTCLYKLELDQASNLQEMVMMCIQI